jgi:hypothetical protein
MSITVCGDGAVLLFSQRHTVMRAPLSVSPRAIPNWVGVMLKACLCLMICSFVMGHEPAITCYWMQHLSSLNKCGQWLRALPRYAHMQA